MKSKVIELDDIRFKDALIEIGEMPVIGRHTRNAANCPLDLYEAKKVITGRQHEAGSLFARDFRAIDQSPGVMNYLKVPANTNLPEFTAISVERWRHACEKLGRVGLSLAMWVVCFDGSCQAWAHNQGVDRKYAIERLRECLDDLADFYGVPRPAR